MSRWANVMLCLVIFLLVGYVINRVAEAPDIVSLLDPGVKPGPRVAALGDRLVLTDYHFELHQVGNRVRAAFALVNNADQPVRDMVIACEFFDRSGEKRGSGRWVIYDTLPARSEGRFVLQEQRYISHLVAPEASNCQIVDAHG